jgi:hypothetical protein
MTENIEPTQNQPAFSREDEVLLSAVAMTRGEWLDAWRAIDSRPEVDTAQAEKEARKTGGMDGMSMAIATRMGPAAEVPVQPRPIDLPPRLASELIRRQLRNPAFWR